ncbi:hypothetical protein [Bacteroides timonensis]|uniref:hypothetical protein n=1 Tax=Bacteroides timonensis TaxID=1470345 RepID=UPI0004B58591|nr:hypothetical protein [Bacteroides timonensis]
MGTMDLNAYRNELAREILGTDDLEVLKKVKKYFARVAKVESSAANAVAEEKEDLTPYTMEEINSWIDEAEAEEEAGIPGIPWEEARADLLKTFPWLCK